MASKKYSNMSVEDLKNVDVKQHAAASRARADIKSNVNKALRDHDKNKAKYEATKKRMEKYSKKNTKPKKNWVQRLKGKVKKVLAADKKKDMETTRTKGVKKQLRQSLSEKEIKKLQGK